jgi:4-hydroxy-2-oxoheptanedioate aldolase
VTDGTLNMKWLPRTEKGTPLIGTFVQISDPSACEATGGSGLDFYCVDAEHAALSRREVEVMIRALNASGAPCLVRTADDSYAQIAGALDAGASGILVPRVESGTQAAAVVAAARFPPHGARGLGPGRAGGYGRRLPDYVREASERVLVGVQIETRAGVDALDAIADTAGVDLLFVGPGDLSSSYQLRDDAKTLEDLVQDTVRRINVSGKLAGLFCGSWDARPAAAQEADLIILSSDMSQLMGSMLELARQAGRRAQ